MCKSKAIVGNRSANSWDVVKPAPLLWGARRSHLSPCRTDIWEFQEDPSSGSFWWPQKVAVPHENICLTCFKSSLDSPLWKLPFRFSCSQSCHLHLGLSSPNTGRFWGIPVGRGLYSWALEVPFVCYFCVFFNSAITQGNFLFTML